MTALCHVKKRFPIAKSLNLRQTDANTVDAILVVDDDLSVRMFISRFLKTKGYRVLDAPGAEEAKRIIRQSSTHVGLVLTDVHMPGTSGTELAGYLEERYPAIRVVYMSGMPDEELLIKSSRRDFLFLQKPFLPDDLLKTIRKAVPSRVHAA